MRTCSARMRTDRRRVSLRSPSPLRYESVLHRLCGAQDAAFTLFELLVVLSILGLLLLLAQGNLFGVLRRSTFKSQVQDFISTMQMAASGAAESGRRFEVIVDPIEQGYLLREITSGDLSEVLDEEIIAQGSFGSSCRLAYVEFDDGDYTNDERAKFRIGRGGWTYGGKVVFFDESEQSYAVVVNRLTPIVQLVAGDPPLMTPKGKDEVSFPK